ncbi:hypothetical protein [Leeuwenhoekiella sp. MAR_2009_132]|uniref:TapB family protein n=1 Tax=Leeuwenhoekiella sp. MAR_2009_132 TaxID=1392489 RepID=UPI00048A986B|nr:hypothetical protein [Leeuwenhoekiella sp. MAR_2009_132]
MKAFYILICLNALLLNECISQNDCSNLFTFNTDSSFEMSAYGTTNNLLSVTNYEVSHIRQTLNGKTAFLSAVNRDVSKKRDTLEQENYEIECTSKSVVLNHRNVVPAFLYDEYSNLEFDISKIALVVPKNLEIGQSLDDAVLEIDILATPIKHRITYLLKDRCVTATETITTPAGTFNCIIIESKTSMKPQNENAGFVKHWFAEGVGFIKQVDYNKKGQVSSVNILTELQL